MTNETKNYTEAQFEKLPKWAQIEINRLTNDVIYYKKKLTNNGLEKSNTFYSINSGMNKEMVNLPNSERITFSLDNKDNNNNNEIQVRVIDDSLEILSNSFDGELLILPRSANRFVLKVK